MQELEVPPRLCGQDLDPRGVPVDAHVRALAAAHDVRHLILFDHQIGDGSLERLREVVEGGQRRRGTAVFHLAHETFREPGCLRQLLYREPASETQVADFPSQLHSVTSGREREREYGVTNRV